MFAKIVINVPSSNVDQEYFYSVPESAESYVSVGSRVLVGFGNVDRLIMGYIVDLTVSCDYEKEVKEIEEVVDYEPVLTKEQIELAYKIHDEVICPIVRILNLMVPNALILKTKKILTLESYQDVDASLSELFSDSNSVVYSKSLRKYDQKIAREVKKGNISVSYEVVRKKLVKTVAKYVINHETYYKEAQFLKPDYYDFLSLILNEEPLTDIELSDKYEVSLYRIARLKKLGFLNKVLEPVSRIKVRDIPLDKKIRNSRNVNINSLIDSLDMDIPLLFIPNSYDEQTEGILQIISKMQKQKSNVLIITPEILTSYRIDNIVRKRTGLSVALVNSKLSDGEFYDLYQEIKNDSYSVIVSTPVGALLPYKNIGCIILLNSQSDNYYNDQSPRYNLKNVMKDYASIIGSKVCYFSFAPSIVDYTRGIKNYYKIIEELNVVHPNVEVIDTTKDLRFGNTSPITSKLEVELIKTKRENKVSVLIVNNKNFSTSVVCRKCGDVISCERCKIPLQYNKKKEMLICPACGNRFQFSNKCPTCLGEDLRFGGYGIEQVVETLKEKRPELKCFVLSESSYDDYNCLMEEISMGDVDVVVTTSNLASSIDSCSIGMVGIINLESVSKMPSFDGVERAYTMLVNVSKICGEGKLFIQTTNPKESFLNDFISANYHDFLKNELTSRKILKNEPFYFINRIFIKAKYDEMFVVAKDVKSFIQVMLGGEVFIIGPTYNYENQSVQIILKHRSENISKIYKLLYEKYQTTQVTIIIDRYPRYI